MNSDTEGFLIAGACLQQALFARLIALRVLSPEDMPTIVGDAEEWLAGMKPELMSPEAREFARRALQMAGKINLRR